MLQDFLMSLILFLQDLIRCGPLRFASLKLSINDESKPPGKWQDIEASSTIALGTMGDES